MIPVTARSTEAPVRSCLRLVPAHGATRVEHVLPIPVGACPVSRNPRGGTVAVSYTPAACAIEVVTLHGALAWACSGDADAPKSAEELASWVAREASAALGVVVVVVLDLEIDPGPQRLRVTA